MYSGDDALNIKTGSVLMEKISILVEKLVEKIEKIFRPKSAVNIENGIYFAGQIRERERERERER